MWANFLYNEQQQLCRSKGRYMRTQASVVIIGAGVMGASVACHLAMRGCTDVVILEQFETEIQGSTARSAAGVRHQFSHELNVRMSQ